MVFKCSKCAFRTTKYKTMQKHYARAHTAKKPKKISKGKSKKTFVFSPPKRKKGVK